MSDSVYEQNVFLRGRVDTLENIVASLQAKSQRADGFEARLLKVEQQLITPTQPDELKAATETVNDLVARVQSLERRLSPTSANQGDLDNTTATDSLSGKRKRIAYANNDVASRAEANVASQGNDIRNLSEQVQDLISQLDHLEHYYERRTQRIGTDVEDLEKHSESQIKCNEQVRGQVKALEDQVAANTAPIAQFKGQLEDLVLKVSQLQQASKRLDTTVSSLTDRCDSKTELNGGLAVKVEALEESLINTTKKLEKNLRKRISFKNKKVEEHIEALDASLEERFGDYEERGEELDDLSYKTRSQSESIESINGKVDLYHYEWQKVQRTVEELKKSRDAEMVNDAARFEKLEKETKAALDAMKKDVDAIKKAVGVGGDQAMAGGVESLDE